VQKQRVAGRKRLARALLHVRVVEQRQFRRLPTQSTASAEIRLWDTTVGLGSSAGKVQLRVMVKDLSWAGMKLYAASLPDLGGRPAVERGSTLTVKLGMGPRTASLPGNVVWVQRGPRGDLLMGVRVHTAILDSNTRRTLATWLGESGQFAAAAK